MIDNFQPIQPTDHEGKPLPSGSMFTKLVTQKILDECQRGVGRPLWQHEVAILDDMMLLMQKQNRKKVKQGRPEKIHSVDELVALFVERVNSKHMRDFADKIAAGQVQAHG